MGTYVEGTGDRSDEDRVGMDLVFTGTGGDGVQFLSPCRPLLHTSGPRSTNRGDEFLMLT